MSEPNRDPEFTEPLPHTIFEHAQPRRPCPYCSELIPPTAVKCSHCSTGLNGEGRDIRIAVAAMSGIICVAAGVYLLNANPADEKNANNMLFVIAHGMGAYFIGKGLYCATSLWPTTPLIKWRPSGARPAKAVPIKVPSPPRPHVQISSRLAAATIGWQKMLLWLVGMALLALLVSTLLAVAFPMSFTAPIEYWRDHISK